MESINSPPSILFLHGYVQNSQIFQQRLKNMTKKFTKKFPQLHYIVPDGPIIVEKSQVDPNAPKDNEIYRAWMTIDKPDDFLSLKSIMYKGMNQSIQDLFTIGKSNSNIQCIFAFSQGAELLLFMNLLSLYKEEYKLKDYFPNLKCLIFVACFFSPIPENDEFKDIIDKIQSNDHLKSDIPSLHVYGLSDEYIIAQKSKDVLKYFTEHEVLEHPGKHFIPSGKNDITSFENFLEKHLNLK